jgi:hypothetical protein
MSTVPKSRIDENVHNLLMNSGSDGPEPPLDKGMRLPEPIYPRLPEKLADPIMHLTGEYGIRLL